MRVLVVSYLPPTVGGIATWAGILRERAPRGDPDFRFAEMSGGGRGRHPTWITRITHTLGLVVRVGIALARGDPDVVHLHCCNSSLGVWRDLLVATLVRLRGVPLIVHFHGSLPDVAGRLPAASRMAWKRLMRMATRNVGLTRESVSLLQRVGGRSPVFLPNYVDDAWLNRLLPSRAPSARVRLRAIFVGACSVAKGTLDLLEAARRVPEMDFLLVGDVEGSVASALASAPANMKAVSAMSRNEVLDLLCDSDVFVFPSRREGFPFAVLEAMAAGLPVVSSPVGAVPEMLDHGCGGWLVRPGDVPGLARALRELSVRPDLRARMGAWNRRRCSETYRFSAVFAELCALYRQAAMEAAIHPAPVHSAPLPGSFRARMP